MNPDEKDDPDARAFSTCASAIERLLEEDEKNPRPLAPQHWPKRGKRQALCGAYGFDAPTLSSVTCVGCKAELGRLARTHGRRARKRGAA